MRKIIKALISFNKRLLAFQRKHPVLDFVFLMLSYSVIFAILGFAYYCHLDVDWQSVVAIAKTDAGDLFAYIVGASAAISFMPITFMYCCDVNDNLSQPDS